jgi:hypothetical protein
LAKNLEFFALPRLSAHQARYQISQTKQPQRNPWQRPDGNLRNDGGGGIVRLRQSDEQLKLEDKNKKGSAENGLPFE